MGVLYTTSVKTKTAARKKPRGVSMSFGLYGSVPQSNGYFVEMQ